MPVTVRLSDGAPDPAIPDNSPNAGPRGMAIRFTLPGGEATDIVAMSHNGFVVATGEEFLELQKAAVATDPTKPHPWPVEQFLGSHPAALKFVQENQVVPASFATQAFFGNNAFVFVNKDGTRQPGRYRILPAAPGEKLGEAEAKDKSPGFLFDDLKSRLAAGPVKYRLAVQLPNPGDSTSDSTQVWPDDRRTIDIGVITITSVVPDSPAAERATSPTTRQPDRRHRAVRRPPPAHASKVYAMSVKRRRRSDERRVPNAPLPLPVTRGRGKG